MSFLGTFIRKATGRYSQKRLALLRSHKTGSQSFRAVFRQCFSSGDICNINFGHQLTRSALEGRRFTSPHMTVQSWLELDVEDQWTIAVTFREPRERLRSSYRYFRQKPLDHATPVGRILREMTYTQYLQSAAPVVCGLKDNILTRFVGGGHFAAGASGRNQLASTSASNSAAKELAIARMEKGLVFPLVLEKAELSNRLLATELGVTNLPALRWRNRTHVQDAELATSDEVYELEERCIEYDIQVYETACTVLHSVRS